MVPPEGQTLIYKSKTLRAEEDFKQAPFKNGGTIGLMGKADGQKRVDLQNIKQKSFVEDMTAEQKARFLKENFGVNSELFKARNS